MVKVVEWIHVEIHRLTIVGLMKHLIRFHACPSVVVVVDPTVSPNTPFSVMCLLEACTLPWVDWWYGLVGWVFFFLSKRHQLNYMHAR